MELNYLKNFKDYKLNELHHHNQSGDYEGKYFILYKKDVWFFDEEEYIEEEIYDEINDVLGDEILYSDLEDSLTNIKEEYPIILTGSIEKNTIYIDSYSEVRHSVLSKDLEKLSKELRMHVNINYIGYDVDNEYTEEGFDDLKNTYFYHGTSLNFFNSIMKTGIKPNPNKANFNNIRHQDKIFITTNIEKALFHAEKAAILNSSYPIILKFKIPDVSKLVGDYDVMLSFYGSEDELNKQLGYTDIFRNVNKGKYITQHNTFNIEHKKDLSKLFGIMGYIGRIPTSYVEKILFNEENYEQFLMLGDDFHENYGLMSDVFNLDNWYELKKDDLYDIIDSYDTDDI